MSEQSDWMAINEQHLAATIKWLRLKLQQQAENEPSKHSNAIELAAQAIINTEENKPPPAMTILAQRLGLSRFEQQLLALCAAMELDTRIAMLCAQAQDDMAKPYPSFALAFSLFDGPDWAALSPHAPLRRWRLIEINQPGAQPLTRAALGIDERILNYLKGLNYLDDRLTPLFDPLVVQSSEEALPPSQQQLVDNILEHMALSNGQRQAPVIELLGHDTISKRLIAERVASASGLNLHAMELESLPAQTGDFETFTRLWQRESLLMPLALYIDVNHASDSEKIRLKRFTERSNSVLFIDRQDTQTETIGHQFSTEVNKPTPEEQEQLWTEALQDQAGSLPQQLAEQFSFSQNEIQRLAAAGLKKTAKADEPLPKLLWQACRIAARAGMEKLARRIDIKADWELLVLPAEQKSLLQQITDQVAQRNRVYEEWGFRQMMNRGLGINALFAGESGTGKTMAAEVIANALNLDLYRIDLSAVVSKYIGETEKNLRKLFDTAEDSGAILFFDEADALFGKRSDVKDSHDRYANIEINYLLQRMENYRGLAILATNIKSALDKAFVRRLRFIIDFPFPGIEEREQIWRKVFTANTPIDDSVDFSRLARFNLTGGNIHNVALNAAFLAAQEGGVVTMPLLLNAARTEFRKLDRPAKESDFLWQEKAKAAV
ncbi:MAG TPA: ATP-binding protein [Gammaproteobacteria bacterium]|nr:ATP-binding protein [Gammaproteobacteria bacterium]